MIPLALKHWKLAGIGLAVLVAAVYVAMLKSSLAGEMRRAARWQQEAVQRGQMLEAQNAAIAELHRVSQARATFAARALAKARKANAGTGAQVEKLRASAVKPSGECVISDTLRTTEGL